MQENKYNDSSFILNTVRQLKGGMKCYVFKRSQVDEVLASYYKNNTNEVEIEKGEYWYILKPTTRVYSRKHF